MQTMTLSGGDKMPVIGLGTWKAEPGQVYQAVLESIKLGYRHIDCAALYMNEPEIGQALTEAFKQGIVKREELWITSKLWNNAHLQDDVRPALEKTLNDLQLEYLDLYLMHWPVALKPDVSFPSKEEDFLSLEEIPIAVTWKAMEACVGQGLTRHIGVSNFSVHKIKELLKDCSIKPEVSQLELHPFLQQNAMLNFCRQENIALTAYSPLGSNDRPARLRTEDEPNLLQNPMIMEIAEHNNISAAQVLLCWAIQRGTIVIPKSVNPERLKQNLDSASIHLTDEEMSKIASLDIHRRYINGSFWAAPAKGYTIDNLWDE